MEPATASPKQPTRSIQVKHYRSSQWSDYRKKVIALDGGKCRECGRSAADGAVLQVHHTTYIEGKAPWEYPYEVCSTLCKGCHAAAHGIIPPKFGWEYAGYDDLGGLNGTCECCGTAIRYVFLVQHPNWRTMEVGEVCCDNLTSSSVATNFMESQRRYQDRLKRFVSSKRWVTLPSGTQRIAQKKICLEIVPKDGGFKIRMEGFLGTLQFSSDLEAKIKAFAAIESGQAKTYIHKQRRKHSDWY